MTSASRADGLRPSRSGIPHIVLLVATIVTVVATLYVARLGGANDRLRFEGLALQTQKSIEHRLEAYVTLLLAGSSAVAAGGTLDFDAFRRYARRLELARNYPGTQGIGLTVRIPPEARDSLVRSMQARGFPDFHVWPDTARDEYHAIVHLEPLDRRNLAAIGYDMYTDAVRRQAMARARDEARPAASGRVTLVQEIEGRRQAGFLIYVPVYRGNVLPATVEGRRDSLLGFVYSPFRAEDLLGGILGPQPLSLLDIQVYDEGPLGPQRLLYDSRALRDSAESGGSPYLADTLGIRLAGRGWALVVQTRDAFEATSARPIAAYTAAAGAVITLLLYLLARLQARGRLEAERMAASARESAEALRRSEARLRRLVDSNIIGIVLWDAEGRILEANDAFLTMIGSSREALADGGITWGDIVTPEHRPLVEESRAELSRRGAHAPLERELVRGDGRRVPVLVGTVGLEEGAGISFLIDLSERRRAEALERERDRIAVLRADVGAAVTAGETLDSMLQACAEAAARHLAALTARIWTLEPPEVAGGSDAAAPATGTAGQDGDGTGAGGTLVLRASAGPGAGSDGASARILLERPDVERIARERRGRLTEGDLEALRIGNGGRNGGRGEELLVGCPLLLGERVVGVMAVSAREPLAPFVGEALAAIADEIALGVERRRSEDALRLSESRYRLMVEQSPLSTQIIAPDGRTVRVNRAWEHLWGVTLEEIANYNLLSDEQLAERGIASLLERAFAGETVAIPPIPYVPDRGPYMGRQIWVRAFAYPIMDETGRVREVVLVHEDITERRRFEEERDRLFGTLERRVEERTAALRESYEQLEAFSYSVAHDLRAPLRAIQGFTELLLEDYGDRLSPGAADYGQRIIGATTRMELLIRDLLAFSRLGRTDFSLEAVDPAEAVAAALAGAEGEIAGAAAEVWVDLAPPPPAVRAHRATLAQMLANLVSNAVKFVEAGTRPRIRIRAERRGGALRLWVEDNGIGIAEEHHERIFGVFERLHPGEVFSGTGIGLAIVKKGAERMGGRVGLESAPGRGSRFWIELPLA